MAGHTKPLSAPSRQVGGDHYAAMDLQPIQVIESWVKYWPREISWHLGNVVKYVGRCGRKDDSTVEIEKAIHYLERARDVLKRSGEIAP